MLSHYKSRYILCSDWETVKRVLDFCGRRGWESAIFFHLLFLLLLLLLLCKWFCCRNASRRVFNLFSAFLFFYFFCFLANCWFFAVTSSLFSVAALKHQRLSCSFQEISTPVSIEVSVCISRKLVLFTFFLNKLYKILSLSYSYYYYYYHWIRSYN